MRITYTNSFFDVLRFQMAHQFSSFSYQAMFVLVGGIIYYIESGNRSAVQALTIASCWYVLGWAFQAAWTALLACTRRSPVDRAEHALEIQHDALLEETEFNRSYHLWHGPLKVVQRGGLVAIYVTPMMAHIVPDRAFESARQRDEFVALIRRHIHQRSTPG